jgi:drug/metabolite transporter (DMT)-like permease
LRSRCEVVSTENDGYGTLSAIIVAVIWGLSFVAARMALSTLTPILLATVRFVIASLIFSPVIVREYTRGNHPDRRDLREYAFLGLLSISLYFWLQYTGIKNAGAGISAILVVGLIPTFTGFASSILLKERLGLWRLLGTGLGLVGVVLIVLPGVVLGDVDWYFLFGVMCLLGNAVIFSLYTTLSRRLMQRIGKPFYVTAHVNMFGALGLIMMSLTSDWGRLFLLDSRQWGSILYLAIVCSGLAYLLWNYSLSKVEAVKAAVWLYLEPVAAFIGEALIFGVVPSLLTLTGGIAILVGAMITNRSNV